MRDFTSSTHSNATADSDIINAIESSGPIPEQKNQKNLKSSVIKRSSKKEAKGSVKHWEKRQGTNNKISEKKKKARKEMNNLTAVFLRSNFLKHSNAAKFSKFIHG